MTMLTGFVPVAQGVAAYAALQAHATATKAAGDQRTRNQIMADTFVERLTGQATAAAVPVEVGLVMTPESMTGQDETPGYVPGYGPVPADVARDLLTPNADEGDQSDLSERVRVWWRRLYASPDDGTLVSMDSRGRCFDGALRQLVVARDQVCRTPWCEAPVRHADHITPAADGGTTSADNGQGLCERCNYVKEWPGWATHRVPDGEGGAHGVAVTTPTGQTYASTAPPILAHLAPPDARAGPATGRPAASGATPRWPGDEKPSVLEDHLQALIDAA